MNLEEIKRNILITSSSFSKNLGEKLCKEGYVKDLKSKSIDDVYHIYSKVLNDNKSKMYSTHIKINKKSDRIIEAKCTCDRYKESSREIKNYVCKHIVGTTLCFYNAAKKSLSKKKITNKEEKIKSDLNLNLGIKFIKTDNIPSLQVEVRIGSKSTHLVLDLKDFIENVILQKEYRVNDLFTFNPNIHKIKDLDLEFFKYLKDNKKDIRGKNLKVYDKNIREFFKTLNKDNKVTLNYNFLNYEVNIKEENVPVVLTLSLKGDEFVLTHHKKFPNPLNIKGDVMLFDRNIYINRKSQVNSYMPLYKELIKNRKLRYKKSKENLNEILNKLKSVTKDITLDHNVREYKREMINAKFFFYKEEEKVFCNIKIDYFGYIVDLIKDKNDTSFLRDKTSEKIIEMDLLKYKFKRSHKDYIFIGEEEDFYNLITRGFNELSTIGKVSFSKGIKDFKAITSKDINSSPIENKNFYNLKYNISDLSIEEIREAMQNIKSNKKFYKVRNTYLTLEDPKVVSFLNLLLDVGFKEDIKIDKNKMFYVNEKLKDRNLSFIKGSEVFSDITNKLLNKDFKRKLVPKALNAELRAYQKEGFKWLNEITELGFSGILADDMGLGKTIQVIAFLLSRKKSKSLVVTPTSLIYNWLLEFSKFAPTLKIGLVHGDKNKRKKVINDYKKYDVILSTYWTLKNDEELYKDIDFDYFIIDEAQSIKNYKAKISESVKSIRSKCNIALTGTPIENNLLELWSIFDFVMPGYLLTKERFKERYIDSENNDELKRLITPFILRRVKGEVLAELPNKIEKKYLVELSDIQRNVYKSYLKEVKEIIEGTKNKINLFSFLTKLRQLCLDPSLVIPDYKGKSAKTEVALDILRESKKQSEKIILFSQFTSVLKNIEEKLKEENITYLYIDGSTPSKDRMKRVEEFNNNKDITVFLISLKAGGVGLNLTSANTVIHFDPWWNPATEDQATDRAHRIGQKNVVRVIKLIAKDTIEEKIVLMQEDKRELIDNLMDGKEMDGKSLKRLSEDEIMELFY